MERHEIVSKKIKRRHLVALFDPKDTVCVSCFKRVKAKRASSKTDASLRGRVRQAIEELSSGIARDEHVPLMAEIEDTATKAELHVGRLFAEMENANAAYMAFTALLADFRERRVNIIAARYENRRKEANYAISKEELRLLVFSRDGFHCRVFMGNPNCTKRNSLTVDHIIPVIENGTDDLENLQTLCSSCNSKKGKRYYSEKRARTED